jgi:hypothetical protein
LKTAAAIESRLGRGVEIPIVDAERGGGSKAERGLNESRGVRPAGFKQTNRNTRVFGQATGHDTPASTSANDDVIKLLILH